MQSQIVYRIGATVRAYCAYLYLIQPSRPNRVFRAAKILFSSSFSPLGSATTLPHGSVRRSSETTTTRPEWKIRIRKITISAPASFDRPDLLIPTRPSAGHFTVLGEKMYTRSVNIINTLQSSSRWRVHGRVRSSRRDGSEGAEGERFGSSSTWASACS